MADRVPFDPNGMAMDMIRSCYNRTMRFVQGDLGTTFVARWFFCRPSALFFPALHRFGSANWDSTRREFAALGDDAMASRTYSKGHNPNRSDGTTFAGPLGYFQEGAPGPGDLPRAFDGTPVECLQPPFGLALGGADVRLFPALGGVRLGGLDRTVSLDRGGLTKSGSSV